MKELLNSFNGGEISPVLTGRVDLPGLKRSCRIMRNFIAGVTGGAFRRPPLLHVSLALPDGVKLLPFNASTGAAYILEAGGGTLRIWTAAGSLEATITGAPWTALQASQLQAVQSNDVMWFTHPGIEPHELQRTASGWTLAPLPWLWPPLRDVNAEATAITSSALTGATTLTATAPVFEAGHVGAFWQLSHFRENGSVEIAVPEVGDASSMLTFTGVAVAGEKVTIGTGADLRVYDWTAATERTAYQVLVPASATLSADALMAAINGTDGTPGTNPHPSVVCTKLTDVTGGTKATGLLTFTNNDLTDGSSPDEFRINGTTENRLYVFADTLTAAWQIKRGATLSESVANAIKAITGTGTAGTHYGAGTTAHADVDATTGSAANSIAVTAKAGGVAGNAIATTVYFTSRMSWANPTLTGGVAGTVSRLVITAKAPGELGNGIPVSTTMTAASWPTLAATTGSSDLGTVDVPAVSPWLRVKGQWDFTTYGRWAGRIYIERENADGSASVVRQFHGKLDENRTASGIEDRTANLRLRVVGMAGKEATDTPAPRFVLEAVEALVNGLVRIDTVAMGGLSATATIVAEIHEPTPTTIWREGAFSDFRGWPSTVALHEERLIFAGHSADPQTVIASQPGDFRNFEETGLADGAWQYRFTSQQANPIRWLLSSRGLIIATSGGERVWDSGDVGITPVHPPIQRQLTFNGAEPVPPLAVGDVALFVARGGQSVLEYSYEQASQSFIAPDLTQLVEHLTASGIKCLAMQRAPFPVLWAVTNDGQLLACTYARREEVVAWTPQPVGGIVSAVAVAYGTTGTADAVWVAVTRNSTLRLERLDPEHWIRLRTGGLLYHMDAATISTAPGGFTSPQLAHLDGMTVSVLADGLELAPRTISGGALSVPGAASVIVGIANPATLQPSLFDFVTDSGSSIGRKFITKAVTIRFYQSRECQYAHSPATEEPYSVYFRDANDPIEDAPVLFNGLRKVQVNGQFMDGINTVFSASGIHPLNILNLVPEFELYGS
jgi:hypothetical protein